MMRSYPFERYATENRVKCAVLVRFFNTCNLYSLFHIHTGERFYLFR